jgi:hypothetical protein
MSGWQFILGIAVGSLGALVILVLAAVEIEQASVALRDLEWRVRRAYEKRREREEAEALEREARIESVTA